MSTATADETIDVASLRVGMFVHLDLGWLAHPFPLSSFRIVSKEQIGTIRALGLKRVRWSSQHSDLAREDDRAAEPVAAARSGLDAACLGREPRGFAGGEGQPRTEAKARRTTCRVAALRTPVRRGDARTQACL